MTVGFALIFQDLALLIWGVDPYSIRPPLMLAGVVTAGPGRFPVYRIFIVVVAVVVGAALWLALDRTRVGAMIRAAVADPEMAQGIGIRVPQISAGIFALAVAPDAVCGVVRPGRRVEPAALDREVPPCPC